MLTAGPASAAKPVVDASGSLHCSISGRVKVSPALLFGGTAGAATFTTKIKGTNCTGTSGITGFKGTYTAVLPSNDCIALATTAFPSSTLTATKYKSSTSKPNPSGTISFTTATFGVSDPLTMDVPGPGSSTVPSGSFVGRHPTIPERSTAMKRSPGVSHRGSFFVGEASRHSGKQPEQGTETAAPSARPRTDLRGF